MQGDLEVEASLRTIISKLRDQQEIDGSRGGTASRCYPALYRDKSLEMISMDYTCFKWVGAVADL